MKTIIFRLIVQPILLLSVGALLIVVVSIPILLIGFISVLVDNVSNWFILLYIPIFGAFFWAIDCYENK